MNRLIKAGIGAVVGGMLATTAQAGVVTYVYTGNDFTSVNGPYTTSDDVSITFTMSTALAPNMPLTSITPIHFTMSDGVDTISGLNAAAAEFQVATDASGDINTWLVGATTSFNSTALDYEVIESNGECCSPSDWGDKNAAVDHLVEGNNINMPGSWAVNGVPEPATWTMLILGRGAVGAAARRRRTGMVAV